MQTLFDTPPKTEHIHCEGLVNPKVPTFDEPRLSGQNLLIYKKLRLGPATNVAFAKLTGSMAVHSRVSDVRQEIQEYGFDLKRIKSDGGVNTYAIIAPNGTVYPLAITVQDYLNLKAGG